MMKANVVAAIQTVNPDFVADMLPPDMGTYWDMNGNMVNWPIPQVVAVNWVASVITAGGDLSYDRSTMDADLPVPSNMNWLNNPDYPSGTGSRNDYVEMGMPAFFAAFMGMQEDVQIAENTRWSLWSEGQQPTKEQEKAAGLAYHNNINLIISKLSGTMDGTTAISDEVKEALVKMMEHPSLN
ncbi:MAG: hypothetical protein HY758_04295 [Nitrospirae bacterium]|nr:hypothetical protein [Nitrospirota bacterium]